MVERFHRSQDEKHKPKSEMLTQGKPLIVVIDDDVSVRQSLQIGLQPKFTVRVCANGNEGIQVVDEHARAVILDIKMAGMDGFQVYKALKAKYPDLPIIFYSAYQDILEGARLSLEYKPFAYFNKNDDAAELFKSIDEAVKHYEKILELHDIGARMRALKHRP